MPQQSLQVAGGNVGGLQKIFHVVPQRVEQAHGLETKYFVASYHDHTNKTFHVQTANNYHERLKTWVQRGLRSVATKYLPNYLACSPHVEVL